MDGTRWVRPYKLGWLISQAGLKKMWRYHCIKAFREAHRAGAFRFPASSAFLKVFPCFNKMLSNLYQKTWYVHIGAALMDPGATVRYIGRYTKRAVPAEYRITYYDGHLVRFRFKDYAKGGKTAYKTLRVLTFLGRLIRHIPDKHFKMIRYAGLFATRWKARYLAQARAALAQETEASTVPSTPPPQPSTSTLPWRERRLATQGVDPLLCKICNRSMRLDLREPSNDRRALRSRRDPDPPRRSRLAAFTWMSSCLAGSRKRLICALTAKPGNGFRCGESISSSGSMG